MPHTEILLLAGHTQKQFQIDGVRLCHVSMRAVEEDAHCSITLIQQWDICINTSTKLSSDTLTEKTKPRAFIRYLLASPSDLLYRASKAESLTLDTGDTTQRP